MAAFGGSQWTISADCWRLTPRAGRAASATPGWGMTRHARCRRHRSSLAALDRLHKAVHEAYGVTRLPKLDRRTRIVHCLQFRWAQFLSGAEDQRKSAVPAPNFGYLVTAQVNFKPREGCLIDFGLPAVGSPDLMPEGTSGLLVERQTAIGWR